MASQEENNIACKADSFPLFMFVSKLILKLTFLIVHNTFKDGRILIAEYKQNVLDGKETYYL